MPTARPSRHASCTYTGVLLGGFRPIERVAPLPHNATIMDDAKRMLTAHDEDVCAAGVGSWQRPASVSVDSLFVDGSDTACHAVVYNLLTFTRHMEAARNAVAQEFDLTGPQYSIFMAIVRLEGRDGITGNALARLLNVSSAFVTLELKQLMARGLITKTTDPKDRRKQRLRVSADGRRTIQRNASVVCKSNDLLFGCLTREEFHQLIALASKLTVRSGRTADVIKMRRTFARKQITVDSSYTRRRIP
jgi:DNA-binding MarR family transcriptional regulator